MLSSLPETILPSDILGTAFQKEKQNLIITFPATRVELLVQWRQLKNIKLHLKISRKVGVTGEEEDKREATRIAVGDLQDGRSHMVETAYCEDPD